MEPRAGAVLPCNVILRAVKGGVGVSTIDPVGSMQAINNEKLYPVAGQVRDLLAQAVAAIRGVSPLPLPARNQVRVQLRWANITDRSLRDNQGSATTPIKGILAVLMLALFTISVGFGVVLLQLPALIERLPGADATPAASPCAASRTWA